MRGIILGRDINGDGIGDRIQIHTAIGRAAVVFDLEGEGGVSIAIGISGWGEDQFALVKLGFGDESTGTHRRAIECETSGPRHCGDLDPTQRIGRSISGIRQAKVGGRKRMASIFRNSDDLVGAVWCVVDRRDIEGDGVGDWVEIDPAVRRSTVIANLETKARVASAIGIGSRNEDQLAGGDIGGAHFVAVIHLILGNGRPIVFQLTRRRQGADLHRRQTVGAGSGSVIRRIRESEVGDGERMGAVFQQGEGFIRTVRGIVDRNDRDSHGVGISHGAAGPGVAVVAGDDGQGIGAVVVGRGRIGQAVQSGIDLGRRAADGHAGRAVVGQAGATTGDGAQGTVADADRGGQCIRGTGFIGIRGIADRDRIAVG